jgi:predicted PurR-regulated permease PerM
MQQIHPNQVRQVFFLLTLTVLGIFIAQHLLFLLAPLLGAIASYVLLRNLMIKLVVQYKWKKWLSALTLILASLLLIILPLVWVGNIGYTKLAPILQQPDIIKDKFFVITEYVNSKLGMQAIKPHHIDSIKNGLLNQGQKVLGGTMQTLGVLGLTLLILYFMLYQTSDVEKWLRTRLPFRDKNKSKVIKKLRDLVYSNAVGVPVVAILQGIVATIGYLIFGAHEPILMGILTIFAAFIPVVGGMLVYVPLGLYLLSQNQQWQGIAVICWGLIIVGSVDNIARFWLQKRMANVHPLVTIFGVIMGVEIFRFLGIIFGPILLSLFTLLIQIYLDEFGFVDADEVDHPFDKGDNL